MTRQEFIEQYKKRIDQILPEFRPDYFIDNDKIGCKSLGNWYYLVIDKCIKIIELTREARQYIYNLKKGNKIKITCYDNKPEVEILKITYKREPDKKGNKIISTFTTKEIFSGGNIYQSKIKISQIIYKGVEFRELLDSYRHCIGIFLNFSSYDIEQVDRILSEVI